MKLISYNLNGIRAAMNKGLMDWFKDESPDILCIQETKAQPDQIEAKHFEELGYTCHWNSADKKGYSGTAIISRIPINHVYYGIGLDKFDIEGRLIRADIGDHTLICSYFPSGSMGDHRQEFKMEYLHAITNYLKKLMQERSKIILTGDFNICHKPIDINNPEKHTTTSGFLPEEREWFDQLMELGFVDTFRAFCQEPNRYSWWSYRGGARSRNVGWRIDYFLASENIQQELVSADIQDWVVHSDHCPVTVDINID